MPTPPQQNAAWTPGNDPLSNAAATLFAQGLADPRGLEYREIEIAAGNPWNGGGNPVKTRGWVFPKSDGQEGSFAVAWDGLVHPVVRVGAAADLHQDWAADAKAAPDAERMFPRTGREILVRPTAPTAMQILLLQRLGEVEMVARLSQLVERKLDADPYLVLATDWAWFAFERAVCAHARGDDRLALADARLLTRIQPLIEAEADRRGLRPNPYSFPDRKAPYLSFLNQLPQLLADCERRVAGAGKPASPAKGDIAALIEDLQNVDARQWGQPGGVSLAQDARVQALVKRGNEVVEPLLVAMENDTRLTRSVSFGRDFHRSRNLIPVSQAAYAALADLMRLDFKSYNEKGERYSGKELADQIREYWGKMGALSPVERFYATLKDDAAGEDKWLQAAANIVQPGDVETRGNWTTIPNRKPGEKVPMRGESLRDGRTPSVAQLLAQRSDDIAAIGTGSTRDHFLYMNAGQMALHLADWDKAAAVPTLKKRLTRAWNIGAEPRDILAFNNSRPAERFGTVIAKMTIACAQGGDETIYDEYAAWIQKTELKNVNFGVPELQKPLVEGAARPSIAQAIEYLFNDPQSPWSNVLGKGNGFWLLEFWKTPLSTTAQFRKQASRGLGDKSLAGTITFNPPAEWNGRTEAQISVGGLGMGFRGSDGDPDIPPPGQKCEFRMCDAYAYFYAKSQKGPKFQLFWSEAKRDAGVEACRAWLDAMAK